MFCFSQILDSKMMEIEFFNALVYSVNAPELKRPSESGLLSPPGIKYRNGH